MENIKIEFFRNIIPSHISEVADVPAYEGNKNKFLKVKEDELGVEWSEIILTQNLFDSKQFEVKNNVVKINDYLSKAAAKELFAPIEHTHKKLEIIDFVESDYVHTSGDEFISGKKIFKDKVTFENDIIITCELSRFGRSTLEVMHIFKLLTEKKIKAHIIKNNIKLNEEENKITNQVLIFAFGLAAEIERDLISSRTKEALARKKVLGQTLGRKKGQQVKSKLDDKRDLIIDYLKKEFIQNLILKNYKLYRLFEFKKIKFDNIKEVWFFKDDRTANHYYLKYDKLNITNDDIELIISKYRDPFIEYSNDYIKFSSFIIFQKKKII